MHRTAARKGLLRPLPPMDLPFLVLVLTLVAFGLVMLCSASSAVALYRRQDAFAYVRPQLLYAAMGLVAMWTASRVDYHIYHKLAWPLLALSLVLLTAVLFMPEYNGCKRWLVLPGLGTLQPSEIAKFAVVLVFAHIIALNHDRMDSFAVGVVPFALVLGVVAVLMLLEPHLSGTVLILSIGAVLMFVGGTGLRGGMLAGAGGAAAGGRRLVDHARRFLRDDAKLRVHRVILDLVLLDRAERAKADVQRDIADLHTHVRDPLQQLLREVQAGCRRGGAAKLAGIDRLVALLILQFLLDVGRQRHLAKVFEHLEENTLKVEFHHAVAVR